MCLLVVLNPVIQLSVERLDHRGLIFSGPASHGLSAISALVEILKGLNASGVWQWRLLPPGLSAADIGFLLGLLAVRKSVCWSLPQGLPQGV